MSKLIVEPSTNSYHGTLAALQPLKQDLHSRLQDLGKIVIKINFVTIKNKLATTPVNAVKAFVDFVQPFYSGQIIIAEEATIGDTFDGFARHGFTDLAEAYSQVELVDSSQAETKQVKLEYPRGELQLPLTKTYTDAPFLVSITRPKTHDSVVVTLAIKNVLVGAIQGGMANRGKIHQGKDIHWILQALSRHVYPDLAIIDGTIGMQGQGPGSGDPIESNWVLTSLDALAADSVATYLMGFDIQDVGYLNLIRDLDKGALYPQDEIEIEGPQLDELKMQYQPHPTFDKQRQWQ
jgi:uncharacterized protein (DUF362 family)